MLIHCDDFMLRKYHMPWWHQRPEWRDAVEPYFAALGVPAHRVVRCLLAKLPAGTTIPVHHDTVWVAALAPTRGGRCAFAGRWMGALSGGWMAFRNPDLAGGP